MSSAARPGVTKELTPAYVREIFKNLESGDGKAFFDHVANDVDWIVEGTHPLAGHYHSKIEFLAHTFDKLNKVLPKGAQLYVEHELVSGNWAIVELHSKAPSGYQHGECLQTNPAASEIHRHSKHFRDVSED